MGTNDQDNDPPQPAEPPREMSLTNDSLMNGEQDEQGQNRPGQNRADQSSMHRPKRRVARRKIRVELIKEPDHGDEERSDAMADDPGSEAAAVPVSPTADGLAAPGAGLPPSGSAYAAASAPATAGGVVSGVQGEARSPVPTQSDNRLHINDLSQMSMPDLRGLASKMGVNHEALISMKKQEIIFQILKAHTEKGGAIYAFGALEILPDGYGFLRSPNYSYLPGPRRHLHLPVADPPLQPEDGGHRGGPDPLPEGGRAVFRNAARGDGELRSASRCADADSVRQPHAAVSR